MKKKTNLKQQLRKLFKTQALAVLSTHNQGQPYGSLVAFAGTEDLKEIVFATLRATRKYANIISDKRVALLIDNRSNKTADFRKAAAATAVGSVKEIPKRKNSRLLKIYLKKHPPLRKFVELPNCALLCVVVKSYFVVNRFQQVMELHFQKKR
ncbi:MAG: hypothetical protein AMJ79_09970 [Phycisphaerae bacterium SM23_30]|nr:MAG: hypothetical protein AMJ79_09970 [Phycisphaerae bacterium SM23_30]